MGDRLFYITVERVGQRREKFKRLLAGHARAKLLELKRDKTVSWIHVEAIEQVYSYFPGDLDLELIR